MKKCLYLLLILFITGKINAQTPCPSPSISGKLTYDNTQSTPLRATMVYLRTLTGAIVDSCTTDPIGNYRFCSVLNGNYKLTSKTNYPWGGVNAADALIAAHHFVELITLTGIRFKAGDVNSNSYINSADAVGITKRFVNMTSSYPIGDWIFEEPLVTVNDTNAQIIELKGLCAGDLDGSNIPFLQTFVTCGDTITDQRDNQKYPTVQIGTQCWMKRNLNIGTMAISIKNSSPHSDVSNNGIIEKYCYDNDTSFCAIYGGLYDWNEMMQYDTTPGIQGICPSGWHIPTDSEWCSMLTFVDPTVNCSVFGYTGTNAGGKLKETGTTHWNSPNTGATNQTGFTALGTGNRTQTGGLAGLNYNADWWSSSKISSTMVVIYSMLNNQSYVARIKGYPVLGFSVRCVKND